MFLLSIPRRQFHSYAAQAAETLAKRSMRMADFLSLTCRLVHAAQYRPAGRPYLATCMFTALRQASRSGAKRVRIGRGVVRDHLRWWQKALAIPNGGVAFFPLNHFSPSGSEDLLEFAYGASGIEGAGAAMLRDEGDGQVVCYFAEHEWTELEKRYHINVKEGIAGYAALTSFCPIAPHRHALTHGGSFCFLNYSMFSYSPAPFPLPLSARAELHPGKFSNIISCGMICVAVAALCPRGGPLVTTDQAPHRARSMRRRSSRIFNDVTRNRHTTSVRAIYFNQIRHESD